MEGKPISKAVIKRLPRYYRYLGELIEEGVERISSNELSEKMRVTASQIRQDLNNFGGFGQQGYGYNVPYLYDEIGKILGLDKTYHMIIIGAGNLGQALANYVKFEKRGFKIVGIFDVNPVLKGISIRGNEIRMMDELPEFLKEQNVDIATPNPAEKQRGRDSGFTGKKRNSGYLEFCTSGFGCTRGCYRRKCTSFRKFNASVL